MCFSSYCAAVRSTGGTSLGFALISYLQSVILITSVSGGYVPWVDMKIQAGRRSVFKFPAWSAGASSEQVAQEFISMDHRASLGALIHSLQSSE